jgi:hypothetical protein
LLQLSVLQQSRAHDFTGHSAARTLHNFSVLVQTAAVAQSLSPISVPFWKVANDVKQYGKPDGHVNVALVHFCCSFGCVVLYLQTLHFRALPKTKQKRNAVDH